MDKLKLYFIAAQGWYSGLSETKKCIVNVSLAFLAGYIVGKIA